MGPHPERTYQRVGIFTTAGTVPFERSLLGKVTIPCIEGPVRYGSSFSRHLDRARPLRRVPRRGKIESVRSPLYRGLRSRGTPFREGLPDVRQQRRRHRSCGNPVGEGAVTAVSTAGFGEAKKRDDCDGAERRQGEEARRGLCRPAGDQAGPARGRGVLLLRVQGGVHARLCTARAGSARGPVGLRALRGGHQGRDDVRGGGWTGERGGEAGGGAGPALRALQAVPIPGPVPAFRGGADRPPEASPAANPGRSAQQPKERLKKLRRRTAGAPRIAGTKDGGPSSIDCAWFFLGQHRTETIQEVLGLVAPALIASMFAVPLPLLGVGLAVLLGLLDGEQCKTDECNPYSVRPRLSLRRPIKMSEKKEH
ncbi:hypothetical protein NL676_033703 [Syzygium grande]|nr:hypothetical protein NL676_033703 [Syzygium grande]